MYRYFPCSSVLEGLQPVEPFVFGLMTNMNVTFEVVGTYLGGDMNELCIDEMNMHARWGWLMSDVVLNVCCDIFLTG